MIETSDLPTQTMISAAHAPFVFFDAAPISGTNAGLITVTLTAKTCAPNEAISIVSGTNVVAYLRCSPAAAVQLKESLERALLVGAPVVGDAPN